MFSTNRHRTWIWVAAITLAAAPCFSGEPEEKPKGIGFGPGVVAAANIPLGKEVDPNIEFEVHNGGKLPRTVKVQALRPQESGIAGWEKGYAAIPDASWCRLDKEEFDVPAESVVKVKAFLNIPDKPENYNRKFMIAIACEGKPPKGKSGAGISLRMVSRLCLETVAKDDATGEGAGSVALLPSVLRDAAKPGSEYKTKIRIRNNSTETVKLTPKRLVDVEPDEEKQPRYYGPGREPVKTTTWLAPLDPFTIEPGKTAEVKMVINVPKDASPGKVYEEVLFLEDEKKNLEFIRVRTSIDK